ncbi:hypothetical protein [Novosphingobium sp. Chol11]|nr:hypothetical protein [Novosphingobium sp. Chol11]
MLPLLGLVQDPLLLRWHARWTRHMVITRLRKLSPIPALLRR